MSQRIGMVLDVFENHTAEVMADKKSACGGCEDTRSCKSCLSAGAKVIAVVRNEPHARPGDLVVVEHTSAALRASAAIFYLFPILGLLVGAFSGGILAESLGMDESGGAVILGLFGLALSLLAVVFFSRSQYAGRRLVPRITRIVETAGNGPMPRRPTAPASPRSSCCG